MAIVESTAHSKVSAFYLVVDDEVIYQVAPNSVLNIGRLDTNDIVLDDYKVSREHAVLKTSRSGFTLVDLASTAAMSTASGSIGATSSLATRSASLVMS